MSERDGFPDGVPCWVAAIEPESERAAEFYSGLFGWETEVVMSSGEMFYLVCKLRGRDVAGIASSGPGAPRLPSAVWSTHVSVASAEAAARRVLEAGGTVILEPFDSPGGGRVAVLADPEGAVFCTWEPQLRKGAQLVNEPSAWAMSHLLTGDAEGARSFYGSVFGWQAEGFVPGLSLLRLPGFVGGEPGQPVPRDVVAAIVELSEEQRASGQAPAWNVDFWIDDADRAAERVGALGGRVVLGPYDAPGFRQCVLADPNGATFTVSQLIMAHA